MKLWRRKHLERGKRIGFEDQERGNWKHTWKILHGLYGPEIGRVTHIYGFDEEDSSRMGHYIALDGNEIPDDRQPTSDDIPKDAFYVIDVLVSELWRNDSDRGTLA